MKENSIASWSFFLNDRRVSQDQIDLYIPYIAQLISNNVPVIFEKQHLAHLIGIDEHVFDKIISSPESFYRSFKIPKKRGGYRDIQSPYPSLLLCQKWIYKNILLVDTPHPCCHGFTPTKSIITNARNHLNKKALLKLDLKDFFSTIPINWAINYFRGIGYADNVAYYLGSICCFNKKLSQGAATSPYLSNLLLKSLDNRLFTLSEKYKISYSRYADDMVFSGDYIPYKLVDIISKIIESYGLSVNKNKTSLLLKAQKRIITGLSVSGKKLALPREYKRSLKNEIHFIKKFGYLSHVEMKKIRDPNYISSLLGRINFWLQIEPDNVMAKEAKVIVVNIIKEMNMV